MSVRVLETDKLLPPRAVYELELKRITFRIGDYAIVKFNVREDESVYDQQLVAEIHPAPNHTDFEPLFLASLWSEFYPPSCSSINLNALALQARNELIKRGIIPDISVTLV